MQKKHNGMKFVKGAATGMLAGVAVAAIGTRMMKENKHLRRDASKAMQAMGNMIGDVEAVFRG